MAAIITNKFRINNAEQFTESFSEASPETYYLFIGRAHSWASDVDVQGNTIAEGTDASPPTPNDDVTSEFYNWDDMLGAKLIASTDVSRVIPRRNWTTGKLTICTNTMLVQETLRRVVLRTFGIQLLLK